MYMLAKNFVIPNRPEATVRNLLHSAAPNPYGPFRSSTVSVPSGGLN